MTVYRYACPERPPMPGTVPREMIGISSEEQTINGRNVWGIVDYNRKLTEKEVYDYELIELDPVVLNE